LGRHRDPKIAPTVDYAKDWLGFDKTSKFYKGFSWKDTTPSADSQPAMKVTSKVLMQRVKAHPHFKNVDTNQIYYYSTTNRGQTISRVSNDKSTFAASDGIVLEIDPNRIDAIRFGYDGGKGVWEARFVNSGGWHRANRNSLSGIDDDLFDRAKKDPMQTVELADGARESNGDLSACGLAHLSLRNPIVFRANRSGEAVSCVLAAYGNVIAMSIDSNQKGLKEIHGLLKSNQKLLCKDAANQMRSLTGIQAAKVKIPLDKLYETLMTYRGLYVVSPETHEGCAGHMIGLDLDRRLIYDCAEPYALPLTVENLDRCAGNDAMCIGFLRAREIKRPGSRGKRGSAIGRKDKQQAKKQRSSA
jgi:hypothetical protein